MRMFMPGSDQLFTTNQSIICPVTGLPITCKPEWTQIQVDSDYYVTFSIIGKAILLITPKGNPTDKGAIRLLEKRAAVIKDAGISDKKYVEIRDYRMLTGTPSKGGRMALINLLLKEQSAGHLQGFWVFGAPLLVRFMAQAGLMLYKAVIPGGVAKDYTEAIRNALKVLRQRGVDVGSKLYARIKKEGWTLEFEDFGISFELIGDDILYTIARGKLKESHVEQFISLHEKVLQESGLTQRGYYCRIVNWERFESTTWKARRMYMHGLNEINNKTPCRMSVIFGLNKFMKALVAINRPFVSIPVFIAKDLQDALMIMEKEREKELRAAPGGKREKPEAKTYTEEQLKKFAKEMLHVIGGINWDQEGVSLDGMQEDHPLKTVLDALAIIKLDLDNMLQEKEKSRKALHESEEMYRFLTENASDTIWMVNLDGTFTYHSPSVKKMRGYTPEEANRIPLAQTLTPASLSLLLRIVKEENAKPMEQRWTDRIMEMEMYRKDGSTIWIAASFRAVRDIEGNVIGIQGSTRDITERKQAEKALRESEERYRSLVENANEAILVIQDGMIKFVNSRAVASFGYSEQEFLSTPVFELIHPEDRNAVIERYLQKINGDSTSTRYTYRTMHKSGQIQWIENSSVLIDWEGKPATLNLVTDITERRQAEKALKQSEAQYRLLADHIKDQVWLMDLNLKPIYISPSVEKSRGYTFEEIEKLPLDKHFTTKSLQSAMEFYEIEVHKVLADPTYSITRSLELEFYRKDGSTLWAENTFSIIRDENGKFLYFLGVGRDITDRRRAERKLLESEEKYRNILENIEDGYFEVDLAGNFTFFNASMCRILGYSHGEMQGMNNRIFMDNENAKKIFRAFHEIYVTGIPTKGYECVTIRKDGARTYTEISISLMVNPGEKPTGFRGVARDVTERKLMEAVEQAKLRAEAANKAKGQFLANMSHEIRTPLNGIMGMAEICLKTDLDEDQKHIVGTITKEANSLLGIINEILDFSKIEAGKLEIEHIPFDLRNLFEDVTESFLHRTISKGLELISFVSPETPALVVGDPGRLRQILRNLIDNAIKFTHEGRIIIKAEPVHEPGDKIKLRFLVADTGIGIPKEKQTLVFESFTQEDGSTTRKYGGTGLGITISKQLAELMGGEIGLESKEGKGSTFWFTCVFSKQVESDWQRRKEVPLSNVRVLLVDDNKVRRQPITEYIRSWGAVPVEAASAKEALSILKESITDRAQVNLVLIELNLRRMNGFDLAREIKRVESLRSIPIIISTSFGNPGDGRTCRDIGIEGYLTKPIRERNLRRTVESVLWPNVSGESVSEIEFVTKYTPADMDRKEIRILLAEDYPTNQEIARRHLEYVGYEVDIAEDGKQALDAFKLRQYDLILMDIQMPVMDGYQATKAIRKIEAELATMGNENATQKIQRVPIIAITAHALREDKELCLDAGMDDFLSKPLTQKKMLAMTAKWLKPKSIRSNLFRTDEMNPDSETLQDVSPTAILKGKPIDLERAIDEFEGDKELLSEVIAGFTKKVSEQLGTIRKALSRDDAETVRKEAHSIKGGAANLTAMDLSKVAFELESKGKSKDLKGAGEIADKLERKFNVLRRYIEKNFPSSS